MTPPVLLGQGTNSLTVGSAVPVNGLVVVYAGSTPGIPSAVGPGSDNRGNGYPVKAGGNLSAICVANLTTALSIGDTITASSPHSTCAVAAAYFPDPGPLAAAGAYARSTLVSPTDGPYTLSSGAPVNSGDLVVAVAAGDDIGAPGSVPVPAGFTQLTRWRADPDTVIYVYYRVVGSTGTVSLAEAWPTATGNPVGASLAAFSLGGRRGLTMVV